MLGSVYAMSTKPDDQSDLETQPRSKAFSLLLLSAAAVFVMVAMVVVPPGVGSRDLEQRLAAIREAGYVLLTGYIGWVFGVFVTVLFGFFVFALGSQVVAGPLRAARVRARLGAVSLTIAGVATALTALAGFGLAKAPDHWGGTVGVVAVLGLISFLAVEVGIFSIPGLTARLESAEGTISRCRHALVRTENRANKPWWIVAVIHAFCSSVAGWAVVAPWVVNDQRDAVMLAVFYLVTSLLAVFPSLMARSAVLERGGPLWKRPEGLAAAFWLGSMIVVLCAIPNAAYPASFLVAAVGVGLCLMAVVSSAWRLVRGHSFSMNWTLAGAASALVHARATRDLLRAEEEKKLVSAALAEQVRQGNTLRERLLAAWTFMAGRPTQRRP